MPVLVACLITVGGCFGHGGNSEAKKGAFAKPSEKKVKYGPDDIGILLGDSVVRGFGSGPVLYESHDSQFKESVYRFDPRKDKPIEALRGYRGIKTWLNRGVTGNPSSAVLARWERDILEKLDRGSQTSRQNVRSILVSTGITDIGAAMGTPKLPEVEENLRQNLLTLTDLANKEGIHIAFLEVPDPTVAPLGVGFTTVGGHSVKSFCDEQEFNGADRKTFVEVIQRLRTFMEKDLREAGAEVIDYAGFLPPEYFWDSHHPGPKGYLLLGKMLRERDPGI